MMNMFGVSIFLLYFCQALVSGNLHLELSSVVFRHGQRSPIQSFPRDDYTEFDWPQGYGQLSVLGMQQHYHLGELLRDRYVEDADLICGNYTRIQVRVRSTDVDRTLMSAESQLASLFVPAEEIFPSLLWRPVPVHTVPSEHDLLLRAWNDCPQYQVLLEESRKCPEYVRMDEDNRGFFDDVATNTGLIAHLVNLSNIWQVYDTVEIENTTEGFQSPLWATEVILMHLKKLNDFSMTNMFNGTAINRLTAGEYLGKILSDMKNRSTPNTTMTERLFLYSAHDTTLAAVMSALQIFDKQQPGYASAFAVELYSDMDGQHYYVQFFKRDGPDSETFDLMEFAHCKNNTLCTLQEFEEFVKPLIPTDIKEECNPTPSSPTPLPSTPIPTPSPTSSPSNDLEGQNRVLRISVIILGSGLCVSLLVAIVLVIILITARKKSKRSGHRYDVLVEN